MAVTPEKSDTQIVQQNIQNTILVGGTAEVQSYAVKKGIVLK